jgi:AcrR family transcriptional regulator
VPTSDSRRDRTQHSLEDALSRLKAGNPNRVRPGYRISVNAVCEEAGISRQTFYKRYRFFEEKIKAVAADIGRPKVSRSRRRELDVRAENEALKTRIVALLSQNATLLHRVEIAERRLEAMSSKKPTTLHGGGVQRS